MVEALVGLPLTLTRGASFQPQPGLAQRPCNAPGGGGVPETAPQGRVHH